MNDKFQRLTMAALLALSLAGCGAGTTDDKLGRFLAAPDKYVLFSCSQLAIAAAGVEARQKELDALIQKAGTSADGRAASALAYEPEYIQLRGDMNEIRRTSAEKECKAAPAPAPAAPAKPAGKKTS